MEGLIRIPFEGAPALAGEEGGQIVLTRQTVIRRAADGGVEFAEEWAVYPVSIVPARYSGSYEGAPWLCFPVDPDGLRTFAFWDGWDGGDVECAMWWHNAAEQRYPIGYGADPSAAYADLMAQLLHLGGVEDGPALP